MSDSGVLSTTPSRPLRGERAALAGFVLILATAMIRAPIPIDADLGSTYQALLYESLRLGRGWGGQFITTDGPLGALLAPAYVSGNVWMAMTWQIAGNLLLAGLLVSAAFRLPWPRRWWALAFLGAILTPLPTLAPWLAMVLLGHELVNRRAPGPFTALPAAIALGVLALSSLGHLLLGLLALLLMLGQRRPTPAKSVAGLGFGLAFVGGWLVLGQSLTGLGLWLAHTLPVLGQTSEFFRPTGIGPAVPWAAAAALALVIALIQHCRGADDRRVCLAPGLFLLGAGWLAWKTIALQPSGFVGFYFATLLLVGFILLQQGLRLGWAGLLVALAVGGLLREDPTKFTDAIGRLNRQMVVNVRMLSALPQLRSTLRTEVEARRAGQALPRIKEAVGDATVDVLGASPGPAILNGLKVRLRPAPLAPLVRTAALAALNGASLAGPGAPAFVLQGIRTQGELAPGLEDGPAQLALYQNYELLLEEKGFMLWRKKTTFPAARTLVASGELAFGQALRVPATGTAYWLELDLSPSLLGRAWALVHEIPAPGLLVHDDAGVELRYPLLPAVTAAGFLVEPFVRGDVDFIRRQSGAKLARTTQITVAPPPTRGWLWAGHCHYRLYAVPGLTLASTTLPPEALQIYRVLSRWPLGSATSFPFAVLTEQGAPVLFAHPASLLEFAISEADRTVRGRIGLLATSYQGTNATDGVDFSIEFLDNNGSRQVVYHRWLDPLAEPRDRGFQDFAVRLPPSHGGRLLLRTYNPPGRGASWDWAFWNNVVIE